MAPTFTDSKIRFAKAKRHFVTLKEETNIFLKNYTEKSYVIEPDPTDAHYYLYKIKGTQCPPDKIVAFITDIIDNLRSSLDLGWRSFVMNAGFNNARVEIKFPFSDSVTSFNNMLSRGFKDFPQEVIALAMRFKPYKGGDDLLWALNRICAANKHRLLTTQFVNFHKIEGQITKWGLGEIPSQLRWNNRKNEIIFFRTKGKIVTYCNIAVTFAISFDKSIDIIGGKPVIATLNILINKVKNILKALEGTTQFMEIV